jgi:cytochrome c oxidase subunit 4
VSEHHEHTESGSARSVEASAAAAATGGGAIAAEHKAPRYMAVFGGLAILTLIEVGVAFLGLPRAATILALLGMAVWKALLVALYYMHLRFEPGLLRLVAAAPLVPAAILILLVMLEY